MKEFQDLIKRIYYEKDKRRGVSRTFQWFVEEVGELARATRDGNRVNLEEEFADVIAWLTSLANLLNISLEEVAFRRYGSGCPKCGSIPCSCKEPEWRQE